MVKKILTVVLFFAACYSVSAQRYYREGERGRDREAYEDDQTYGDGFKTEHLFIGGNLGLGYDSYTFSAGISPEVGYSFARWFDAGVLVNLNYSSERADAYYNDNTRLRSFNYGIGAFARAYPFAILYPSYFQFFSSWLHRIPRLFGFSEHVDVQELEKH